MNRRDPSFIRECLRMIRQERMWWLIPFILSLALVGLIATVATSPAAPFIYTLF